MTAAFLVAAWAAIGTIGTELGKLDKTVIIDGDSFRVIGDQTEMLVERQGVVVAADPDMHIAAIEAAKQASGCNTVRYFSTTPGVFHLELSCPRISYWSGAPEADNHQLPQFGGDRPRGYRLDTAPDGQP